MFNYTPNFKKVSIGLCAVIFISMGLELSSGKYNEVNSLKLIKPSEVNLSDLREEQGQQFRKLYGEITNKSADSIINTVGFKIIYKNCRDGVNNQSCSKIGEESTIIMKTVLPGESIAFETILSSNYPNVNKFMFMERQVDYVKASKV